MNELQMFCHQCQMSAPGGCGAKGQKMGTCGKNSTLANLQMKLSLKKWRCFLMRKLQSANTAT